MNALQKIMKKRIVGMPVNGRSIVPIATVSSAAKWLRKRNKDASKNK
tara:strand:+ start:5526 stop:5666 length:141 start_codon:yes stop_codon:yes gene_type:complete